MEPNLQETCEADTEEAQKKVASLETSQSSTDSTSHVNINGLEPSSSAFELGIPDENSIHLGKSCMGTSGITERGCKRLKIAGNTNKDTSPEPEITKYVAKSLLALKTSVQPLMGDVKQSPQKVSETILQQSNKRERCKSVHHSFEHAHSTMVKGTVMQAEISSNDTNLLSKTLLVSQQDTCQTERHSRKGQLTDHLKCSAADKNSAAQNELELESHLTPETLPLQQNIGKKRGRCKKAQSNLMSSPAVDLSNLSTNGGSSEVDSVPGLVPVKIPKKPGRKPKSAMVVPVKEILSHSNIENGGEREVGGPQQVEIIKKQRRKPKNAKAVPVEEAVPQTPSIENCTSIENGADNEMGMHELIKIPKKRGRKPKNVKAVPVEGVNLQIPSTGSCNNAGSGSDSEMGVTQPVKIPKKRGRKPKNAKPVSSEGVVLQIPSTDVCTDTENGEASERRMPEPVKIPKKRGRKPKSEMVAPEENTDTHGLLKPIVQKLLEQRDAGEELEASGRPKRRAARAALLYLREIVEEIKSPSYKVDDVTASTNSEPDQSQHKSPSELQSSPTQRRGKRKKKSSDDDVFDDLSDDKDFVVSDGVTDDEEEELSEVDVPGDISESDLDDPYNEEYQKPRKVPTNKQSRNAKRRLYGNFANGLPNNIMVPVWEATTITIKHREEHHSPWVFPDWIPSSQDWSFLSQSESLKYLPSETNSPSFKIKREGLREDLTIHNLSRFQSLPAHKERWDVNFFVGGPVWCLEWCPTPEGSAACQYAAIYCNKGMDDRHKLMCQHVEPTLLQIWQLGDLQQEKCPQMNAALAYGIATDYGCVWDMKWCPSGTWELPETARKLPQMARLGILAAAFSSGKVVVYSLPHPEFLNMYKMKLLKASSVQGPIICKVQCTVILEIGSIQYSGSSQCGQCFCLDWMPSEEHQCLAAGFYDGTVALWNLNTKSLLLRVQQGDGSLKIYPFHSFVAHDHAVKAIAWSKAHSNFLVTASPDRKIKFWDLRRTYQPVNDIKRYLNTEVAWLLPWCGVMVAQENCYAAFGLSGIHYLDAGFLGFKPYFAAPRTGTVWSISGSDWLNTCVSGDNTGEVIAVILPDCMNNTMNIKRPNERRFPIYKADLVDHNAVSSISSASPNQEVKEAKIQKKSSAKEKEDLNSSCIPEPKTYSETVKKYYLMFDDTDLVRFNPNLDAHGWVLSAGQSGIVRAHCVRSLNTHVSRKLIKEYQAQFSSMFQPAVTTN
ncbi:general transcription factor 3C polypeptide 2 isoform X2 [Pristis pectinata]|uniref:general transcription factor 3C polypeptide 2 isoform X2 n=1 Tax=Pristis pectinata TaxID=685728 RepID=UPI00223E0257|nr:general transcription factor 3C polypeptide 2 isoform X2 [Pristis pectinata]